MSGYDDDDLDDRCWFCDRSPCRCEEMDDEADAELGNWTSPAAPPAEAAVETPSALPHHEEQS